MDQGSIAAPTAFGPACFVRATCWWFLSVGWPPDATRQRRYSRQTPEGLTGTLAKNNSNFPAPVELNKKLDAYTLSSPIVSTRTASRLFPALRF
jgi:hypothetical protein